MREPYISEELIRIQIEAYDIHFVFIDTVLQIGANFSVVGQGLGSSEFKPGERKGDLVVLWSLIGQTVKDATWDDEVTILFENGSRIRIPMAEGIIRGSIVGRHKVDDKIYWQDF